MVFCLYVCLCITCTPTAHGGQERESDPLEQELYRWLLAMTWVLGIKFMSSGRSDSAFSPWSFSPVPLFIYFRARAYASQAGLSLST